MRQRPLHLTLLRCLVAGVATLPSVAFAWGTEGHKIVATIAAHRLNAHATAAVKRILKNDTTGHTLPAVAVWADTVRKGRPTTYNWHFADIDVTKSAFDDADCHPANEAQKGDCIINALTREVPKLTKKGVSAPQRAEALKFVTHFIGDLHQPLHCAERNKDRGGNDVTVTFFGQTNEPPPFQKYLWNLHAAWDFGLIEHAGGTQAAYVTRLETWIGTQNVSGIESGTFVDWANESHAAAVAHAYKTPNGSADFPATGGTIEQPYYDANIGIVDQQLAKAGVRLAKVLNDAFP